jgi:dTDP-4-amino-4,6-dideoxygalactose transaminase
MITTNNAEWDAKFRLWRQHSMGVPDTVRHQANQVIFESYEELGYNYRMTDIQAAVGREQLQRLLAMVARRREQTQLYRQLLAGVPGLALPEELQWARSNWQSFCVRLPEFVNQREAMQALLDAGIASRRGIMCAHREPAYTTEPWSCGEGPGACGCAPGTCRRLQESERAQDRSIVLPLYHQMTDADQDRVATALREVCAG